MPGRPTMLLSLSALILAVSACGGEEAPATPEAPAVVTKAPEPPPPVRPADPPPAIADGPKAGGPAPAGAVLTIKVKQHTDRMRSLANETSALLKQLDKEAADVAAKAATLQPGNNASVRQMEGQSRQLQAKAAELHAKLQELQKVVNLVETETDKLRVRAER